MIQPGLFITFEGGEGSGKTTQINRLAQSLTNARRKVITTREPGGTEEGEKIRSLLVQRGGGPWTPLAECLMFYAARALHVEKIIKPALAKGKIVLCDRFADSTFAYQGYGYGFDLGRIAKIHQAALDDFKPDLTFLCDIDAEKGLARSQKRLGAESLHIQQTEDRYESLELDFHKRLRAGFLELAKREPDRFIILDASQPVDELAKEILFQANKMLETRE